MAGTASPFTAEDLGRVLTVSRETLERLTVYLERLRTWNERINLVGRGSLVDPWRRHVLDSAQLLRFIPGDAVRLVDMGSGAGLPGLVLAICRDLDAHLIESDQRKAAFLRDTAARLGVRATVHAQRIESVQAMPADIVTARALAPLPRLLELGGRFATERTRFLFLEGRSVQADLRDARTTWTMHAVIESSLSAADGRILLLDEVRPIDRTAEPERS